MIRRALAPLVILTLGGVAGAGAGYLLTPVTWRAESALQARQYIGKMPPGGFDRFMRRFDAAMQARAARLTGREAAEVVIQDLRGQGFGIAKDPEAGDRLARQVRATFVPDTEIIHVSFESRDPRASAAAVQSLLKYGVSTPLQIDEYEYAVFERVAFSSVVERSRSRVGWTCGALAGAVLAGAGVAVAARSRPRPIE